MQILMATMHRKSISDIDWNYKNIKSEVILVNQADYVGVEKNENIKMLSCLERGSSNSRNMAIKNASSEICLIADDDVAYVDNLEFIVEGVFGEYPDADVITFQIKTPQGDPFNSGYPKKAQWHNARSILRCASIEIAFRREAITKSGLRLDTDFGLGSKYLVHDEVIFLKDALDKGLKLLYVPIPIVIHPAESSGSNFTKHLVMSKGAAFVRLFGLKGMFLNFLFAIKKYPIYKDKFGFFNFLFMEFKGAFSIINKKGIL